MRASIFPPLLRFSVGFFLIDQVSKNWALNQPGLFVFHNTGLFFGLWPGSALALMIGSLVVLIITQRILKSEIQPGIKVASALILGGAVGNLFDRLVRGYALDWLDLKILIPFWPADWPRYSNLADVFIGIGLLVLIGLVILSKKPSSNGAVVMPDSGSRAL